MTSGRVRLRSAVIQRWKVLVNAGTIMCAALAVFLGKLDGKSPATLAAYGVAVVALWFLFRHPGVAYWLTTVLLGAPDPPTDPLAEARFNGIRPYEDGLLGRDIELSECKRLLSGDNNGSLLVLHGKRGAGKTSFVLGGLRKELAERLEIMSGLSLISRIRPDTVEQYDPAESADVLVVEQMEDALGAGLLKSKAQLVDPALALFAKFEKVVLVVRSDERGRLLDFARIARARGSKLFDDIAHAMLEIRPFEEQQAIRILEEILEPEIRDQSAEWAAGVRRFAELLVKDNCRADEDSGRLEVLPIELQILGSTLEGYFPGREAFSVSSYKAAGGRLGLFRHFVDGVRKSAAFAAEGRVSDAQVMKLLWLLAVDGGCFSLRDLARQLGCRRSDVELIAEFLHRSFLLTRERSHSREGDRYRCAHDYLGQVIRDSRDPEAQRAFLARRRLRFWVDEAEIRANQNASGAKGSRLVRRAFSFLRPPMPLRDLIRYGKYATSERERHLVWGTRRAFAVRAFLLVAVGSVYWNSFRAWPLTHWYRNPFLVMTDVDQGGSTCLHRAAAESDVAAIRYVCGKGAALGATDATGDTPLYVAATSYGGSLPAVAALVELGADVNVSNNFGYTPLQAAAYLGKPQSVAFLLEHGAELEEADFEGFTPALKAARSNRVGSAAALALLVEAGASISHRDHLGATALHHAVASLMVDKVRLLIENGADRRVRDIGGRTPLELLKMLPAISGRQKERAAIVALLK